MSSRVIDFDGDFSPTVAMLQLFAENRQVVRMHFFTPSKKKLLLSYKKEKHTTLVYFDGVYVGRLSSSGTMKLSGFGESWPGWDEAKDVLNQLLLDPLQAAKTSAAISGICCFCGIELTDERSKSVGYGPRCAENGNLPWGEFKPINLEDLF